MDFNYSRSYAKALDQQDSLSPFRNHFAFPDPNLIYLDGNSLGRQSYTSAEQLQNLINDWSHNLIRGYNLNWWQAPIRIGEKIAKLVGAGPDQVISCDSVSVNLYKLASAALALRAKRTKIITDTLNFPSDLYILQGLVHFLGGHHQIISIGSKDGEITPDLNELDRALDDDTALVTLSHVTFKSGYMYDMKAISRIAHKRGALVLWDLSHSVGSVPVGLDECEVDYAIGCTYKYLNGGPGSPAFLYVRKDIQESSVSPIWGWWGQNTPFAFDLDFSPAPGITRFLTGSPPILSLLTMEAALESCLEAGMENIRNKSILLSEYLIKLTEKNLIPLGFSFGTSLNPKERGSHISLRHPEGYRINRALIEELNVIPDFREPDNLRLGLAPLYTSFLDVWEGIDRIRRTVIEKRFENYPTQHLTVT